MVVLIVNPLSRWSARADAVNATKENCVNIQTALNKLSVNETEIVRVEEATRWIRICLINMYLGNNLR